MANQFHDANQESWDAVSPHWQAGIDAAGNWRRVHQDPSLVFSQQEMAWMQEISAGEICVLGSGDNLVAFALAGMGARVTSVDISQSQLDIAAERAQELGLTIHFMRADVTDLSELADGAFDMVYTGGHVAVWVSDLWRYYAEACRILKPGGRLIVNEYHPFRRLWRYGEDRLELDYGYYDRGPHHFDRSDEVPGAERGSLSGYEFHWTVSDFVSALLDAGCELLLLDEFGDDMQDWEAAPLKGLPENLLLVCRKRGDR